MSVNVLIVEFAAEFVNEFDLLIELVGDKNSELHPELQFNPKS